MKVIDIFKDLAKKVPRCSADKSAMIDFLIAFAKKHSCTYKIDDIGNILLTKGNPKICLQAHYDIVCLNDGSSIEIVEENGWLKAKNSTLGADNGIGIAMILALFEEEYEIEALFTSDEEIGMLGARELNLEISSPYVLNLDSEEEGFVYVGCAGGFEIIATKQLENSVFSDDGNIEQIKINDLPGGHSGIDIDKEIPNAIIELLLKLKKTKSKIISFEGGEKLNSIPMNAVCEHIPNNSASSELIDFLCSLPNGVIERNIDMGIPETSINFAKLTVKDSITTVQMYARSMDSLKMLELENLLTRTFTRNGFEVKARGHYKPWEAKVNEFAQFVRNIMKKYFFTSGFKAIHAGLECGVLKEKMQNKQFASIGANIMSPHTLDERVEIVSVEKVYEALKDIIRSA